MQRGSPARPDLPSTPYNARSKPLLRTNDVHLHAATRRGGAAENTARTVLYCPARVLRSFAGDRPPIRTGCYENKRDPTPNTIACFDRSLKSRREPPPTKFFPSVFHCVYCIFFFFFFFFCCIFLSFELLDASFATRNEIASVHLRVSREKVFSISLSLHFFSLKYS